MTRTIRNTTGTLLAAMFAVLFVLSSCLLTHAENSYVTRELQVSQSVMASANSSKVKVSYVLTPARTGIPMPVDGEGDARSSFSLTGTDIEKMTVTFTEPGLYEYTLVGTVTTPKNATFTDSDFAAEKDATSITHVFGYKVLSADDGSLEVIPYTCEDKDIEILDKGAGLLVKNYLAVDEPTTTSTTTTTKKPAAKPTRNNGSSHSGNNTSGSGSSRNGTTRGGRVNTGDESQLLLWLTLLAVAGLGLVIIILAKRRRDDEEETK